MNKSDLALLSNKYRENADRYYREYKESGIIRYLREHRKADELADALDIAARASDDYAQLVFLRGTLAECAAKAVDLQNLPFSEAERSAKINEILTVLIGSANTLGIV